VISFFTNFKNFKILNKNNYPKAGPNIRTPIVIAIYSGDCLDLTLSSMHGIPRVAIAVCPTPTHKRLTAKIINTYSLVSLSFVSPP
jgi:hypothetical protein